MDDNTEELKEIKLDLDKIPPMTYFILSKRGLSAHNLNGEKGTVETNDKMSFANASYLSISEDGELMVLTFDSSKSFKIVDTNQEKGEKKKKKIN